VKLISCVLLGFVLDHLSPDFRQSGLFSFERRKNGTKLLVPATMPHATIGIEEDLFGVSD
jgi:hypothetical protein